MYAKYQTYSIGQEEVTMLMYSVVPHNGSEIRFFMSFSEVEQLVRCHAMERVDAGFPADWCKVLAYEGVDELFPIFLYTIANEHILIRTPFNQSPSGS